MNKIVSVSTKVRPIKKLFVMEADDKEALLHILRTVSKEITGEQNLILINDENLLSSDTRLFIKSHDPDVILNCSAAEPAILLQEFRAPTYGKAMMSAFSTPLSLFNNAPIKFKPYISAVESDSAEVYACIAEDDDAVNESALVYGLNCGLIPPTFQDRLKRTVFGHTKIRAISSDGEFWAGALDREKNFLHLAEVYSQNSTSSSIWSMKHNPKHFFTKNPVVIIGECHDVHGMVYFWNVRATFPEAKVVFVTRSLLFKEMGRFTGVWDYCIMTTLSDEETQKLDAADWRRIDPSVYYFPDRNDWKGFEHTQNVAVVDGVVKISHPHDRLFSNQALLCVLQIFGLEEAFIPQCVSTGDLFIRASDRKMFPEQFTRISARGISTSIRKFSLLSDESLTITVTIPEEKTLLETFLSEAALFITHARGSRTIQRLLHLVGGPSKLEAFSDRDVFEMIVRLAPKRVERIVKEILKHATQEDEATLRSGISSAMLNNMRSSFKCVIQANEWLLGMPKARRGLSEVCDKLEELIRTKVILRGKFFRCPGCDSDLWFPLQNIPERPICYCCDQIVHLPSFEDGKLLGDAIRLNELVCTAVDQGVLPVLLTVRLLDKERYVAKRYLFDCVLTKGAKEIAEIDILCTLGNRIGLAEVKADRGFEIAQVDRLVFAAHLIRADFLLFSTLKSSTSDEVASLMHYLFNLNLRIPAFILAQEALFSASPLKFYRAFETHEEGLFSVGPLLLQPQANDDAS